MNAPTPSYAAPEGFEPLEIPDDFLSHIGPFFTRHDAERDTWTVAVRTEARHSNRYGLVHGGYLSTLADVAIGTNIGRVAGDSAPVTAHLDLDFVGAAQAGAWIEAHTRLTKRGGRLLFGECHIQAGDVTVARSSAIFFARRDAG